MKKKLIILFFLLVPISSVIFHACCPCDVETQRRNYSHKALLLKNLDNSGEKAIETEALQLNKNAYGIRLYLEREKIVVARTKSINSFFIQSAYATSCECPPEFLYYPNDSIVSIKIFTVNNFDNQHLENSDVTDYFRVAGSYSTIESYVAKMRYTFASDYAYGFEYWEQEFKLDLLLMTAPTANNKQQFEIQVALSDGRILKQQTLEIELL
jgi:hypothetical protein